MGLISIVLGGIFTSDLINVTKTRIKYEAINYLNLNWCYFKVWMVYGDLLL